MEMNLSDMKPVLGLSTITMTNLIKLTKTLLSN